MESLELNINALIEQLDLAITENDNEKVTKIGEAIESLLAELNGDTIQLRVLH